MKGKGIMRNILKKGMAILLAVSVTAALAACGGQSASSGESGSGEKKSVVVGSKDFTENEIVAEIYALALEDAGFKVERKMNIAGSVVHTSITSGEIDLYPEYTGTGLITILGMEALTDQDEVYNTVKDAYNKQFNITWLDYAQANDGQGLFISRKASDEYAKLPKEFTAEDVAKLCDLEPGTAQKRVYRWMRAGYVTIKKNSKPAVYMKIVNEVMLC